FAGVAAGAHTITVTDANNCSGVAPVTLTAPGQLIATAAGTDPLCFGGTGSISASATGGMGAYLFALDGGTPQASGTFAAVAAGAHTITVTDANNCSAAAPVTLTAPAQLVATATGTDPLCFGGTGSISASATGGTGAYLFALDGGTPQANGTFAAVAAGAHTIPVTDANSCTATAPVTLTAPAQLVATATGINPLCFGGTGS